MIRFRYCGTHVKDEEYMNKMSSRGWNAKSLTEGFCMFVPITCLIAIYYLVCLHLMIEYTKLINSMIFP